MGAGVPSGLQNRFEELSPSQVGSIPTYSCQIQRKVCALIGNINLNRRTKNTHKMGMGNFKESAGMLKNTL